MVLIDTSLQSWTCVCADEPKSRALVPLSAEAAEHGAGVGVELQLSWATWLATAAFQMDCHWEAYREAVMTFDVVSRPPDAVMS